MPNDETLKLMNEGARKGSWLQVFMPTTYSIDEVDNRFCMMSLDFTGCYAVISLAKIDPERKGMVWIDGVQTEPPILVNKDPFGQMVGFHIRKYVDDRDSDHTIFYDGAYDADGNRLEPYSLTIHTLSRTEPGVVYPEHDALTLQAAREGAVLLKNENGALPLGKGETVNVFGKGVIQYRLGCLGAGKINPRYGIGVKEGIERYSSLKLNEELYQFYRCEEDVLPPEEMMARARSASETAVVFITRGSSESQEMEKGKGGFLLTDEEFALLKAVREKFTRVIAVLNVAYPIETGWAEELGIDSLLWVSLPGMNGGRALAEMLEGTVCPSGKLANTWAKRYEDYPSAKNFVIGVPAAGPMSRDFITTVYEEGIYVGYRYFSTFGVKDKVAYPFGYGLSYTEFEKEVVSFEKEGDAAVSVSVKVKNTGAVSGKETVLLFAEIPGGALEQPAIRLAAYKKTKLLKPGEEETVSLKVTAEELKSYSEEKAAWLIEAGTIRFSMGDAETRTEVGALEIPEEITLKKVENRMTPPIEIRELSVRDKNADVLPGENTKFWPEKECGGKLPFSKEVPAPKEDDGEREYHGAVITFDQVVENPKLARSFIAQMSDEELARLSAGGRTGWGVDDNGFAGVIYNGGILEKYKIPDYFFSDGNNGLNMNEPNVGFPVSSVIASTFNEEIPYAEGRAIAKEGLGMELDCILAPALNIQRNPLCGRHAEYFSEDPLVAGRMSGQEAKGLEEGGVSAVVKHFIANNAETLRYTNHSIMSERAAREIYLRAFEVSLSVHQPDAVMTGYNAVNGAYASNNTELLDGVLRGEWGYDGYLMTDWGGYGDKGFPGLLAAGMSFIAPGAMDDSVTRPVKEALGDGSLDRGLLIGRLSVMIEKIAGQLRRKAAL